LTGIFRWLTVYFGSKAQRWICGTGPRGVVAFRARALMAWQAFWFDKNWTLQKLNYPGRSLPAAPVFIVGLWRSGTTYLHELLADHPAFYTPQTWQCFGVSSFLTTGLPSRSRAIERRMDHHIISTISPQEDEFALMALGIPSAYLGFFRPDVLDQLHYVLSPDYWLKEAGYAWGDEWLRFLQMLPHAPNQRLLLKSPNHLFRMPSLAGMFPDAKWIYIFRDTDVCLESNRKMWHSMFKEYAVTMRPPASMDSFLQSACVGAAAALEWATNHCKEGDLMTIDLRELSDAPIDTLVRLSDFLGIAAGHDWTKAVSRLAPAPSARRGTTRICFNSPGLQASADRLKSSHAKLSMVFGAPVPRISKEW
jgi:hypothetical protein